MYVIKRKDKEEYLYMNGNTYKIGAINKCSTYLSLSGAHEALTKGKSTFYLAHALNLHPKDFEILEVALILKTK